MSFALAALGVAALACDPAAPARDGGGASPELDGGSVDAGRPAEGSDAAMPAADAGMGPPRTLGTAERPATLVVPTAHDGVTPLPVAILLHGYSTAGNIQDLYFGASRHARANGYYLVIPDGTRDASGNRFWNATPACCDFGGTGVDDVAYLTGLLDQVEASVPVDTTRVYFFGHSNGGYMSYRMACELSDRITAIVSLAGADFLGDMDCVPTRPLSVLQVHGTLDTSVAYGGTAAYPSARATVTRAATRAGCDPMAVQTLDPLDLDTTLPGSETRVERWSTGCTAGLDAELWTIEAGLHIPTFGPSWMPSIMGWMLRHHR